MTGRAVAQRAPSPSTAPGPRQRAALRRVAKRRAGMTRAQHEELRQLHAWPVMLRANAAVFVEKVGKRTVERWWGACEHCHAVGWLQVSHIEPKGQYPHLRYDPENARALCWRCHMHWWHKNPREASEWIRQVMGETARDRLALRARARCSGPRPGYVALRLLLLSERGKMLAQGRR